jgi:hypothetical protein
MKERARWSYAEIAIITIILSVFAIRVGPRVTEANPESGICDLIDGLESAGAGIAGWRLDTDNGVF